jgi:hypothetical protein
MPSHKLLNVVTPDVRAELDTNTHGCNLLVNVFFEVANGSSVM